MNSAPSDYLRHNLARSQANARREEIVGIRPRHILNIGLARSGQSDLTVRQVLDVLNQRHLGLTVVSTVVKHSATEPTLVAVVEGLNDAIAFRISEQLEQDAIAIYEQHTKRGALIGPRAEAWGKFTLAFFLFP